MISDPSTIPFSGTINDKNRAGIRLSFTLCNKTNSEESGCATDDEIRAYFSDQYFMLWGIQNYIDMEKVLPADDTLKQGLNNLIMAKLDLEKNQTKLLVLEEYRTELYDDNINFMGLSEPKKLITSTSQRMQEIIQRLALVLQYVLLFRSVKRRRSKSAKSSTSS